MTQPEAKPKARLTGADYLRLTPPSHRGVRYQLIEGELIKMAGANEPHQVFIGELYFAARSQIGSAGAFEIRLPPFDVYMDEHNTFQPDLLFVSVQRRHILSERGVIGAPDVVVEVLSESTRQRDLNVKMPVYGRNGVREMWVVDLLSETVAQYLGDGRRMALRKEHNSEDVLAAEAIPGLEIDLAPIFASVRGLSLPNN